MEENKSSISKAGSYQEIGEYWDAHDLSETWDETEDVEFEVDLKADVYYFAVESSLSSKLNSIAARRGVSSETLVNLWLQEKVNREITKE